MIKNLASGILISAIAISAPFAVAALAVAPFDASAAAVGLTEADIAARIDGAFASLPQTHIDPAAAAARPAKGDFPRPADCAGVTWPHVDTWCLLTADGSPAPHVRTITIGYEGGANTTVLMRIPAAEVAQR